MFNLEEALADWRRQMAAAGIQSPEWLDELETHLRDDFDQQVVGGVELEQAFGCAVRRLGTARALRREFAKGSGTVAGRRRFVQTLCFASAVAVFLINTWTLLEYELSPLARLAGIGIVGLVAAYLAWVPFAAPWWLARTRMRGAVKLASGLLVLMPLFALLTPLRAIRLENGVIPSMIFWLFYAALALTILAAGLTGGPDRHSGWGGPLQPVWPGPIRPDAPWLGGFSAPPASAFAPTAKQCLELARAEALRLGHDYVGTEHVLLGVVKLAQGSLAKVLEKTHLEPEAVRKEIERLVVAQPSHSTAPTLPFTPRAQKALELAGREAKTGKAPLINADHILLGLLREGRGFGALALKNLGVQVEQLRAEVSAANRAS